MFLDEIGELPPALQPALLRVIQEGTFKRVGGTRWQTTRFRLIAATHRDLVADQASGGFRSDLYYRLGRECLGIDEYIAEGMWPARGKKSLGGQAVLLGRQSQHAASPELTPEVEQMLIHRDYPGNVRDLRQLALRVAARHVGSGPVTAGDIPLEDRPRRAASAVAPEITGWPERLEQIVREALIDGCGLKELKALVPEIATRVALESGGPGTAARMLGISRRAMEYRKSAAASRSEVDPEADVVPDDEPA